MYTILLDESNLLKTTVRERIMQRSKLVDTLHFLVDPDYKGLDMAGFTATLEYVKPVSREYKVEYLTKSEELYKEKLEYTLPFDTELTREAGDIEISLTFTKADLSPDGIPSQKVRKTSSTTITILPVTAWSNVIADSALSALDQRLIQVDAAIAALNDMNNYLDETKADNIVYNADKQSLQLTANGSPIGDVCEISANNSGNCGCGISSFVVNESEEIIVTLTNGQVINVGEVIGATGVTFIPHISEDNILTWTNDGGLENPPPTDLNPFDEWTFIAEDGVESDYEWEYI